MKDSGNIASGSSIQVEELLNIFCFWRLIYTECSTHVWFQNLVSGRTVHALQWSTFVPLECLECCLSQQNYWSVTKDWKNEGMEQSDLPPLATVCKGRLKLGGHKMGLQMSRPPGPLYGYAQCVPKGLISWRKGQNKVDQRGGRGKNQVILLTKSSQVFFRPIYIFSVIILH